MLSNILKIPLFVIAFCAFNFNSFSQAGMTKEDLKSMTFGQRMYYGGILGASFGTITSVQLMPIVGYRILPRWSAGVGVTYQYYKDNRTPVYETNIFGGNIHSRVFVWQNLFAHTEFEILNFEAPYYESPGMPVMTRVNVPALFIGAGYFLPIGQRSGMSITFLYDLIQDINSPYPSNYTLRIGFVL